jgi:DNA-binding Lrp family transcriptional regulator
MAIGEREKALLQELCTNSRVSMLELSHKFRVSRYKVVNAIEVLEKRLGLQYALELDYKKLGFGSMHITYLKFVRKPGIKVLENVLNKMTSIQLALLTKGDFDLICFVVTKTPLEYSQIEIGLQMLLEEYGAGVRSNEVTLMRHGFVPLDNCLLGKSDVDETDKKILLALNDDSHAKLRDISRSAGITKDVIHYRLAKIEQSHIIKRYTAIVTKPNTKFSVAYFANYSVRQNLQMRINKERHDIIFANDENSDINDFQIMFATTGSAQTFNLATYVNKKYGMAHSLLAHNRIYATDKVEVNSAEVVRTLKGRLPLRYIDVKTNYDETNWPLEFS